MKKKNNNNFTYSHSDHKCNDSDILIFFFIRFIMLVERQKFDWVYTIYHGIET